MNIDWSKAPEDATHFDASNFHINSFMKFDGNQWFYWPVEASDPIWCQWGDNITQNISGMIERPKKQDAWDGEGLPPEKCDCEVLWSSDTGEYVTATVLAHDQGGAIVRYTSGKNKGCISEQIVGYFNFKGCQIPNFRPIKTAEQLAEEEKKKVIDDMQRIYEESILGYSSRLGHASRPAIKALYEAGYRKQ